MNEKSLNKCIIQYDFKEIFDQISKKFVINDTIELDLFKNKKMDDVIKEINNYNTDTGIMINTICITEKAYINILVFDDFILIIERKQAHLLRSFFIKMISSNQKFFFLNDESKDDFNKIISEKNLFCNDEYFKIQDINEKKEIKQKIIEKITQCIIKKSQIRTRTRQHYDNDTEYKYNNFIKIDNLGGLVGLYFNTKDQYLYALKSFYFEKLREYNYELEFYKKINNKTPFISKYFGNIETSDGLYIIITEYIEGETLYEFIKHNKNEITSFEKMLIILDVIIAVEYIHMNDIIIRDLKYDNIMINTNKNAILIDFDQCIQNYDCKKEMEEISITSNIGSSFFAAPEQLNSNKYSFKSDVYSLAMIIHCILTEISCFDIDNELIQQINQNQKNVLDHEKFPKCPKEFLEFEKIYKCELEYSPEKRLNISKFVQMIFYTIRLNKFSIQDQNSRLKELCQNLCYIREKEFNLRYNSSSASKNDLYSDISYSLGYYYYPHDIQKSIFYYELASDQNDQMAQMSLGLIYINENNIELAMFLSISFSIPFL